MPTLNRHHSGHMRGSPRCAFDVPVCGRGMLRHQPPRYTRHFLVPLERVLRCLEIGNYWIIGGKTLEGPSCCAAPFVYVLTQRFYLLTQPCYEPAIYTPQCCRPCDSSSICCTYTLCWCTVSFHTAWLLLVGPLVRIRRGDGMAYVWIRQNLYSANYRVSQKASSNHPCVATSFHGVPVAALIHGCPPDHPQQCVVRFRATTNHLKCTHSTDPSRASLLAEVAPGTESVI